MFDERKSGFNWKDILVKIVLLGLFLLLLFWIIPRPDLNTFYDAVFNNNLQTMKDAARNYYTVERLPAKVNESDKMSLRDMLNEKMIIPFVDKNNESCDLTDSYIQVTKVDTQMYQLKVQLHCGKNDEQQIDYVIDTIGCYDVCVGDDCETDDPLGYEKKTQYQLSKQVCTDVTSLKCEAGYTLVGNKCVKGGNTVEGGTPVPIKSGGNTITEPAKVNTGTNYEVYAEKITTAGKSEKVYNSGAVVRSNLGYAYSCSVGSLSGTSCVYGASASTSSSYGSWYFAQSYHQRTPKTPYIGDTAKLVDNGTSREKSCDTCTTYVTYYNYTLYYRAKNTNTSYSCPYGGTVSGTNCVLGANSSHRGYSYSCATGYNSEGSGSSIKCYTVNTTATTYSCPAGYNERGSGANLVCYKLERSADKYYCERVGAVLDEKNKTCSFKTDEVITGYNCPDGETYNKDKQICEKYIGGESKDPQKITTNKCEDKYKWSYNNSEEGWKYTGKNREVNILDKSPATGI